jgi:hypothetical protein
MTQIDKEAVKRLSRTMHLYGSHWKVGNVFSEQRAADCGRAADTLLTLLAALDAAEARNTCCEGCQEALRVARAALAEDDTPGEKEGE